MMIFQDSTQCPPYREIVTDKIHRREIEELKKRTVVKFFHAENSFQLNLRFEVRAFVYRLNLYALYRLDGKKVGDFGWGRVRSNARRSNWLMNV